MLCAQGRENEAAAFIQLAAESASPDNLTKGAVLSAQARVMTRRGEADEGIRLAHEAVAILQSTDWLSYHADSLVVLAEVLETAGRSGGAVEVLEEAVRLYERKGNAVAARKTRERLSGPRPTHAA